MSDDPKDIRVPDAASERRLEEIRRAAELRYQRGELAPVSAAGRPNVPVLKEPQWTWEVPLYFFVGGAAGAAAVIASVAQLSGAERRLVREARWIAAIGGAVSAPLLIADLGRPERFLHMLRVFKLQSAMSVGAWTLVAFSSAAGAAAFADVVAEKTDLPVAVLGDAAGAVAAATGLVLASYTGVLLGCTAIPVWNRNARSLPLHFTASGLNSAVGMLELMGHERNRALGALGLAASAAEVLEGIRLEADDDPALDPVKHGAAGWMTRAGGVLSGPLPLALRVAAAFSGRRSAGNLRKAVAVASLAGSLLTRFGWVEAGKISARDRKIPLGLDRGQPTEGTDDTDGLFIG
jgi:hypothetical protein